MTFKRYHELMKTQIAVTSKEREAIEMGFITMFWIGFALGVIIPAAFILFIDQP